MSISFDQRVAVAPDVLFRLVGDEAVLLNLKTELYLGLDPVGTRMWNVLKEAATIPAAYDTLLAQQAVQPERLRGDLDELLGKLMEQKLIEIGPAEVSA